MWKSVWYKGIWSWDILKQVRFWVWSSGDSCCENGKRIVLGKGVYCEIPEHGFLWFHEGYRMYRCFLVRMMWIYYPKRWNRYWWDPTELEASTLHAEIQLFHNFEWLWVREVVVNTLTMMCIDVEDTDDYSHQKFNPSLLPPEHEVSYNGSRKWLCRSHFYAQHVNCTRERYGFPNSCITLPTISMSHKTNYGIHFPVRRLPNHFLQNDLSLTFLINACPSLTSVFLHQWFISTRRRELPTFTSGRAPACLLKVC